MSSDSIPWRKLRSNPRGESESGEERISTKNNEAEIFELNSLSKKLMFGTICGGITGITFGLMDVHRVLTNDQLGKFSTPALKIKEASRLTTVSAGIFGTYFCAYQGVKYCSQIARNSNDMWNVFVATTVTGLPVFFSPPLRSRFPYIFFLVAVDTLNSHLL